MAHLHAPWLELAIATPAIGAIVVGRLRDPETAWKRALVVTGVTLVLSLGAWCDFTYSQTSVADSPWTLVANLFGDNALQIDQISAPLIPLSALLYFVVILATLRTKIRRFPFAWTLVSLALILALFSCRTPWGIIAILALQVAPPWLELRSRQRSTRVFTLHMLLSLALIVVGWALFSSHGVDTVSRNIAVGLLAAGVLIRCGVVPVHCWMTDLFEKATLGTALLFVAPMPGVYAAIRLLLPNAPDWTLRGIAFASLATAIYAAGMALVQRGSRRFFCFLFLSNASLVLVGLEVATPVSLAGGLALWLSVAISLTGLGLTLRALEARCGTLSLVQFHGLYEHMPRLAAFFLLTGLASIGFPGTAGFVGAELLVESAVQLAPAVGVIVVLVAALNGIAFMRAYFRLFTGHKHVSSISLEARWPEKIAVLAMTALIIGGGLWPQPGVASRYRAATEIISQRGQRVSKQETMPIAGVAAFISAKNH